MTSRYQPSPANPATARHLNPAASLLETAHGFLLRAEMPGVPQEGVEVTVHRQLLTLVGRRPEKPTAGTTLHRESEPGDFRRTFRLDRAIDASGIRASIDQGVLTLELPKAEAALPRRILVAE